MVDTRTALAQSDTLRLIWPQWQGAGETSVRRLLPELPYGEARRVYALGTRVLTALLPEHAGPTEIVPVSAATGERVGRLTDLLVGRMPPGPPLYPRDAVTGETEETLIAELIREAALEDLQDELPHSLAVTVEEIDGATIRADLHVERDSQKGIVIGKGGRQLTRIGRTARKGIERLLGGHVYLDLRVKVAKNWQRDPKKMGRLGF